MSEGENMNAGEITTNSAVFECAKQSCQNSGHPVENHIEDILDMVDIGSGTQKAVVGR